MIKKQDLIIAKAATALQKLEKTQLLKKML